MLSVTYTLGLAMSLASRPQPRGHVIQCPLLVQVHRERASPLPPSTPAMAPNRAGPSPSTGPYFSMLEPCEHLPVSLVPMLWALLALSPMARPIVGLAVVTRGISQKNEMAAETRLEDSVTQAQSSRSRHDNRPGLEPAGRGVMGPSHWVWRHFMQWPWVWVTAGSSHLHWPLVCLHVPTAPPRLTAPWT